jgi:hypothetical protein
LISTPERKAAGLPKLQVTGFHVSEDDNLNWNLMIRTLQCDLACASYDSSHVLEIRRYM